MGMTNFDVIIRVWTTEESSRGLRGLPSGNSFNDLLLLNQSGNILFKFIS
jgi:hypothetical protein